MYAISKITLMMNCWSTFVIAQATVFHLPFVKVEFICLRNSTEEFKIWYSQTLSIHRAKLGQPNALNWPRRVHHSNNTKTADGALNSLRARAWICLLSRNLSIDSISTSATSHWREWPGSPHQRSGSHNLVGWAVLSPTQGGRWRGEEELSETNLVGWVVISPTQGWRWKGEEELSERHLKCFMTFIEQVQIFSEYWNEIFCFMYTFHVICFASNGFNITYSQLVKYFTML